MASIGRYNTLQVLRETASGFYLDGGAEGEILLPGALAPTDLQWGREIRVFVYSDSEDRLVATTEKPKATAGEFAALEVLAVHPRIGAFLDWGLSKDLLLPFREQRERVVEGERVVVFVKLDERSGRVIATMKWNRHLSKAPPPYAPAQRVRFLISHRTPLGYHAIVEGKYSGLIYHSNLGTPLAAGQSIEGYVQSLRPDGKIDLSLDPGGPQQMRDLTSQIMEALEQNGGRLPFDDNSSPESIRDRFNTSKKAFKRALSSLYKQRRILFSERGGIERGE